ncbi:STAS domain-containing protein [Streptomyces smyrnaeus]|uniref:STAS domain-containing protein n=1 Tax=Streptomyces smyrnaeus TaxID=1387713 RepID=UPI0033B4F1B4
MSENTRAFAPFHTERLDSGVTVVELGGEIDLRTAPPLTALLDTLTTGRRPDLVVDLRPVSFLDCSGLRLLCRARNRTLARHGRLRLVSDSGHFLRILAHARLSGVFEVHTQLPPLPAHTVGPAPTTGVTPTGPTGWCTSRAFTALPTR